MYERREAGPTKEIELSNKQENKKSTSREKNFIKGIWLPQAQNSTKKQRLMKLKFDSINPISVLEGGGRSGSVRPMCCILHYIVGSKSQQIFSLNFTVDGMSGTGTRKQVLGRVWINTRPAPLRHHPSHLSFPCERLKRNAALCFVIQTTTTSISLDVSIQNGEVSGDDDGCSCHFLRL